MRILIILGASLALLTPMSNQVLADDKPFNNSRPLSEIMANLESRGFVPVEVEYEDGFWEVEAYKDGVEHEVMIDSQSGNVISIEADD